MIPRLKPLILLMVAAAGLVGGAAASPLSRALSLELAAGPLIGLDRALRGGALALGLGLAPAALLEEREGEHLALGGRAELSYDRSLESWQADYALCLALGRSLSLELGGELPISQASLDAGGGVSGGSAKGARLALAPLAFPSRFVAAATIVELARARAEEGRFPERPRLVLEARLGWTAYEARGREGEAEDPELSGAAGFSAGLVAGLFLALRWGR
jgi:hypothetical protein